MDTWYLHLNFYLTRIVETSCWLMQETETEPREVKIWALISIDV